MNRVSVRSSNIQSVGYDADSSILEIEFHSGALYQYYGVPQRVHEGLMTARSTGTYFNDHVKEKYRSTQIRGAK